MYFGVYDDITIQKLNVKGKRPILIRVLEPSYLKNGIPYEIKNIDQYLDVLELYFDDIIIPAIQKPTNNIYFSKEMAMKLNKFILKNDFDEIAIHCSGGISRSPAIGLCIAKILQNESLENMINEWGHFIPNQQVLSTFESFQYETKRNDSDIVFRNSEIYHFDKKDLYNIDKFIIFDQDEER